MKEGYQELLERVLAEGRAAAGSGTVANYIPALAAASAQFVGLALTDGSGRTYSAGEARQPFTLQSVSKILALALALEERGSEAVFSRVGKEPSGDPFNSIIRLETSRLGKPFNPLINAGAIAVSALLPGASPEERVERLLRFSARAVGRAELAIDEEVYRSERATANRNRAIAWFLKELGLLDGEVEDALDGYFRQCSLLLDAEGLSRLGALLAFDGQAPWSGERVMSIRSARTVKALMMSCGLYDGSGEFAVEAGLPAKSGVGGGIVASAQKRYGIGSFGPALDRRGNSAAGIRMLIRLSEELDLYEL